MALKSAVVQAAVRVGTGTQDFTDAIFSSDVKAAVLIGSRATATDTATAVTRWSNGFAAATGGNTQLSCAAYSHNAASLTDCRTSALSTAACYRTRDTAIDGTAAIDSWLSNGLRVNWSIASENNELVTVLLLGGDIEAKVVTATFTGAAAPDTQTVAHGLSGAPELILVMQARAADFSSNIGAWETGGTYIRSYVEAVDAGANTAVNTSTGTDGVYKQPGNSDLIGINNVGATNFDAVMLVGASTTTIGFLCLRGTTSPIVSKLGSFATKITSTGVEVEVSGMSVAPTVFLAVPSLRTSLGEGAQDSASGLLMASKNNGTTQQGGVSHIEDNGLAATSQPPPYDRSTIDSALVLMAVNGTEDVVATIDSWDSGGVSLNYSNIGASAFAIPYIAFGIAVSGGGPVNLLSGKLGGLLTGKL